ncbi:MAG TPA: class I SAM-dependent methyltransferase [Acidimicrobiales bacterium]|nr:class I SAM-dependent methyltransferase [Acidimicrobiales bacterium]
MTGSAEDERASRRFESDVESWESLARSDPLWAVLSSEEFRGSVGGEAKARFWDSGEEHVDHVLSILRHELRPGFEPGVALDFGCGVGRNLVPLARRSGWAVGLDASATMVDRARARMAECGVKNAEALVVGRRIDPEAAGELGPVDFVHSVLVFQHIVATEGFALFDQLLDLLCPGGLGFCQFHCKNPGGETQRVLRGLRLRHDWFNTFALKSRVPLFRDLVMLYEYDMAELLFHLAAHRVDDVVVERTTAGPGGYDARLYFAKFSGSAEEFEVAGRAMKVRMRP